ncbi:TonB-dependent receptor [Marinobacter hydrocarbonoclasticus]|nr:TonB-dependent receptor [Marinobacter nauticus]
MRLKPLLFVLFATSLGTAAPALANPTSGTPPYAALMVDYVAADQAMWGVTIAPTHYDRAYPDWGYYAGFAWGPSERLDLPEPEAGKVEQYMGRFGLSYEMVQGLYLTGGVSYWVKETHHTNGITPLCTDCTPVWTSKKDYTWGGELGLRYNLGQNLVIGVGYNWATESAMFSLGLR